MSQYSKKPITKTAANAACVCCQLEPLAISQERPVVTGAPRRKKTVKIGIEILAGSAPDAIVAREPAAASAKWKIVPVSTNGRS